MNEEDFKLIGLKAYKDQLGKAKNQVAPGTGLDQLYDRELVLINKKINER